MGVEAYTTEISLGSSAKCYIDNANPTTAYAGSTRIEQEDFADNDGAADTDDAFETTDTQMDTDDASISDHVSVGDILLLKPSGGALRTELMLALSMSGDKIETERGYDGTTEAADIPTNADIYKSLLNTCVTLCTFTVAGPATHGITSDAILKDIRFNYNVTSHTGTVFVGLLKSDFSPTNATWNTSDGSATWNPRFGGGSKGLEKIYKAYVSEASGPTVSLKPFVEAYGLTWGSKVNLAIWHNATSAPTTSPVAGFTVNSLEYAVLYEDPAPTTPQLEITASDDGLTWWDQRSGSQQTGTINVVNGLDDKDLTQLYLTTTTSSSDGTYASTALDAYNDNSGPHLTSTDVGRREFNTKELSNPGLVTVAGPVTGDNQFWYYRMFVEDVNNVTANAASSNVVKAVRPEITSALTYNKEGTQTESFEVGDLVELKVICDSTFTTNRHHAGGPAKGKIKKLYVNWNALPSASYRSGSNYYGIVLGADLAAGGTTITVNRQYGLDGYIYESGVNEVYLVLDTEQDSPSAGVPENLEIVKVTAAAGSDTTYTIARAQFGTTDIAHESGASKIYVYSPAKTPQKGLYNVGNVESIDNYVEYVLPSPASTTDGSITLTHRYGVDNHIIEAVATSTYEFVEYQTIRVVAEDEYGWRSDAFSITNIQNTLRVPEASINASRGETALASTAGDRETAVVLSGANSRSYGGGKHVKHYKWSCTQAASADIITSGVLDINNEPLEAASRKLYARSNKLDYENAVITIIGLASFDADGSSIADDAAGFNDGYYKYVKATVSPGADAGVSATTGWGAAADDADSNDIYFKQVDFVYLTTVDATASASEIYQIFSSDADGTEPTAHDKSRCVVPRLCVDTDQNIWGGLVTIAATAGSGGTSGYGARIKADSSNQRFESVAAGGHEDFVTDGFAPGDFMIVKGGFTKANQGMYLIDKVQDNSGTFEIHVDTSFRKIDSTETVTQTTKKEMYVTKPSISVANESDATEVFNLIVADSRDEVSLAATVSIPFKTPNTLDLDSAHAAGNLAIQSVKISRGSTLNANMPIGMRRYPVGTMHTKYGMPTLSMSVRVMDDTGFAYMTQLIDNRYNFAKYAYKKIASSTTTYVTYKLKLQSWSVDKKPEQASHEIYNLNFVISGESV